VRRRLRRLVASAAALCVVAGCASTTPPPPPELDLGPVRQPAWSSTLPGPDWKPRRAQVTPVGVVVDTERGVLLLDRGTGSVRWQQIIGGEHMTAIAGRAVVIASGDSTAATVKILDLETGATRAELAAAGILGTVLVTPDTVYLVSADTANARGRRLAAHNVSNGALRWQRGYPEARVQLAPPTVANATAALVVADAADPLNATAVDALVVSVVRSGRWSTTGVAPATGADLATFPDAAQATLDVADANRGQRMVSAGTVLRWDPNAQGCELNLAALDAGTGAPRWQATIGQWQTRFLHTEGCHPPWNPQTYGDRLLTTDAGKRLQVRDLATGAVRWTGAEGTRPLTVSGDTVVAYHAGSLQGYEANSGARLWEISFGSAHPAVWTLAGGEHAGLRDRLVVTLFATGGPADNNDARVVAFDSRTGKPQWSTTGRLHLLGASADGVVAARYQFSPTDPAEPPQIRFYPT
jgi:outer membrane protein assembly factor BamB